jgi:chlorophyll synthase
MRQRPAIDAPITTQPQTVRRLTRLRDLLQIGRPRFWIASVVPIHIGFVLATHRIVPRADELAALVPAIIAVGPLLWVSALAFNDAHDLDTDRLNPRKVDSPLVAGRISAHETNRIGWIAGFLTVLVAALVGPLFMLGAAATVLLGWAYSAPPLRLKARPGADVTVNAGSVGVIGPLGGWVAITGTTAGFPWLLSLIGVLAAAALYLPTTASDLAADRATGIRTAAVAWGSRVTFELGFALWTASAAIAFVMAFTGTVIDESLLPLHIVMAPFLLALYRVLLRDRPSFRAITVVASAYLVPCAAFMITYVS